MVFIHVKRVGDKKYYTLRVSVRKGDEVVTKDICNLGSDLSKINIGQLEAKYRGEVRKSYRTIKKFLDAGHYLEKAKSLKPRQDDYFNNEQIIELGAILLHYNSKFLKLDSLTQNEFMDNFILNFAVNSTAIEGNTITMKQAHSLFNEDIIPKDKSLREVNDLVNTKKVWEYLIKDKPDLDLRLIEKIHDMLLENIDKRLEYRAHEIQILGQPFKPSPVRYVIADVKLLLDWYKENIGNMHPLALAIFFHHKFENIHPFSDGNGRTGRVLMNYILVQNGYPPFVVSRRFRKEYLRALNEADQSLRKGITKIELAYYRNLLDFLCKQYKRSYWDIFLA